MFLVPNDRALEVVKAKEVGNFPCIRVLDDIAPHDLLLRLFLGRHPVLKVRLVKDLREVHARKVALEQVDDGVDVLLLEETETGRGCYVWELIPDDLARLCAAMGERREADVVELLPVDCAVEVAACGDGRGEHGADGVDGLVCALDVAAAGDLLDEDGGEAFCAQLLVDAEEVYFGAVECLGADAQGDGDAGDEGDELA
jgi:hypothetical protein